MTACCVRQRVYPGVIALDGAHERFGHSVGLRALTGVVRGSKPMSRAKARVSLAM